MMCHWTEEENNFLVKQWVLHTTQEMAKIWKSIFGVARSSKELDLQLKVLKAKKDRDSVEWSTPELLYLQRVWPYFTAKDLSIQWEGRFGVERSGSAIRSFASHNKISKTPQDAFSLSEAAEMLGVTKAALRQNTKVRQYFVGNKKSGYFLPVRYWGEVERIYSKPCSSGQYYSSLEVASILGYTQNEVNQLARNGKLPAHKGAKIYYFDSKLIDKVADKMVRLEITSKVPSWDVFMSEILVDIDKKVT